MLEAVMLAEAKDRANWELLAQMAAGWPPARCATSSRPSPRVLAQEEEHYTWARDTRAEMLFALATGGAVEHARRRRRIDLDP